MLFLPILRLLHMILGVSTPQKFPPPLPPHEEAQAFKVMKEAQGDVARSARQKLILHNLRLVSHMVRKYYAVSKNQEDLISIGTIGLCKAIDSYDTEAGTRFATYAARCIQNEILMYFRAEKKHSQEISMNETIDVFGEVEKGNMEPVRKWLGEHIWQHGSLYTPAVLMEKAFGGSFDASYYVKYLTEKFTEIYSL